MIPPLSLRLGLSAISEGEKHISSGQVEPGLRLIRHGLEYLEAFLPSPEPRIASEIDIATDNLKRKAGAA